MTSVANVIIFTLFIVLALHACIQNKLDKPAFFRHPIEENYSDLKNELMSYVYTNNDIPYEKNVIGSRESATFPNENTDLSSQFDIPVQPHVPPSRIAGPDANESILNGGIVNGFNLDGLTGLDPYNAVHAVYT